MSELKKTLEAIIVVGILVSPWTLSVASDISAPQLKNKVEIDSGWGLGADTDFGDMGQNFPDIGGQPLDLPNSNFPNESSPEDSCVGPFCPGGVEIPGT